MRKTAGVTTLYLRGIPRETAREAKAQAARRGKTLARYIAEVLDTSGEPARGTGREAADPLAASVAWFERNRARLAVEHADEFVAIIGDRVVDHDRDFDRLSRRVFFPGSPQAVYVPHVRPPGQAKVHSPRIASR